MASAEDSVPTNIVGFAQEAIFIMTIIQLFCKHMFHELRRLKALQTQQQKRKDEQREA